MQHKYDPKCLCVYCYYVEKKIHASIQQEKEVYWNHRGAWGSGPHMISPNVFPSQRRND